MQLLLLKQLTVKIARMMQHSSLATAALLQQPCYNSLATVALLQQPCYSSLATVALLQRPCYSSLATVASGKLSGQRRTYANFGGQIA